MECRESDLTWIRTTCKTQDYAPLKTTYDEGFVRSFDHVPPQDELNSCLMECIPNNRDSWFYGSEFLKNSVLPKEPPPVPTERGR